MKSNYPKSNYPKDILSGCPVPKSGHSKPKQYRPVPPGKKLIFRWSRTDPATGRIIYARNRPFPILVNDTAALPRRPMPVRKLAATPLKRATPIKPIQPVKLVKPIQPVKPVGTKPVMTLAPAMPLQATPVKLASVKYQLREDVQDVFGAVGGATRAGARLPSGQSAAKTLAELLGGAAAGAGGARLSAVVRQAGSEDRALITQGVSSVVMPKTDELASQCRELADAFGQQAQQHAGPNGDTMAQFGYAAAELLMHFLAGAANGAPAGYLTHQALEEPTEDNIKLLTGSF